jgi:hypothetical protein
MPEPLMKAATVDMLRAYLLTASLAAMLVELVVLAAIVVFGISEETFQSKAFRLSVILILLATVLATRQIARAAFRSAVANRHVTFSGVLFETVTAETVTVSPTCPGRPLVILYLRLNRRLFELAER